MNTKNSTVHSKNPEEGIHLQPKCQVCGKIQPVIRIPRNFYQLFHGGWTCKNCGSLLNRHGNLLKKKD